MKRLKALTLIALGMAAIGLTGCNQNRDRDDDNDSGTFQYDQVGETRVFDERPAPRKHLIQAMPVNQALPQVAKSTRSFQYNQIGETDITQ